MNQACFFEPGNNFNAPAGCRAHPFEECAGISGVAQCAGGDYTYGVCSGTLGSAMKSAQDLYRGGDCFGREKSAAEYGLAQACDLAIFVNFDQVMGGEAGDLEADGVRSD